MNAHQRRVESRWRTRRLAFVMTKMKRLDDWHARMERAAFYALTTHEPIDHPLLTGTSTDTDPKRPA